jgi:hypothetical protein
MTTKHIRYFQYVNKPYQQVREAIQADPLGAFKRATRSAAARADDVGAQLHVDIGGVTVAKDIEITVEKVEETQRSARLGPVTTLQLRWKAADSAHLFPLMRADLSIYPLTSTETQLDFSGDYEVPLNVLGKAIDALVGHRIAEASVQRFVSEVSEYLRV